ncbi:DUF6414 family protein [Glutamicibacter arilaitensis]|uniref:DUF6414 family protein n=1 Tax=Glutamicibacter arilaitensis TaxID=256701 RepID=UPI003A8E970E
MTSSEAETDKSLIKIVYFDEESASDYLDISAGGKSASTREQVQERSRETHTKVEAGLIAKLSWLPFLGASGELGAGAGMAAAGNSILSKTLSNTILTDYLVMADSDSRITKLRNLRMIAPEGSMAFMKMFTPYMVMLKMDEAPVDFARMDEVLAGAKGYYELLGEKPDGTRSVLRFNLNAFRNNYGLTDLGRMRLVFQGIHVGQALESSLSMKAEMAPNDEPEVLSAIDILDGPSKESAGLLDVYDVILAGVEDVS